MSPPPDPILTPAQISFYHENGYLALESVMPESEIALVREIYDHLFTKGHARDITENLPQILNPGEFAPELRKTRMFANCLALMRDLLGPDARFVGDHAINKPPQSGAATPWHQDEAYWDPAKEYKGLSIWIPLQPATHQNGCMTFVPGSHRSEVLPHRPIGDNPRVSGLELDPDVTKLSKVVACELPPGGATIHDGRTLHYTPPNRSTDFRRAYIVTGMSIERTREVPRRFPWKEQQEAARA